MSRRTRERNLSAYLLLIVAIVISAGPLVLVVINSLRPDQDIKTGPLGPLTSLTVTNYVRAWSEAGLGGYLINSLLVTAAALLLGLGLSMPIAYALGRWVFPGRSVLNVLLLAGLMIPLRIGALPLFHILDAYGLVDTRIGLVLVYAAIGMPMAVLILSVFYRNLSPSLAEAARIDGAGEFTIFARILSPLVTPAVATVLVLNIAPAWNDLFFPLILLRSPERFVLPVGISKFFSEFGVDLGLLYAGLVIAAAPLVILFAFTMKRVVGGLTAGMEK